MPEAEALLESLDTLGLRACRHGGDDVAYVQVQSLQAMLVALAEPTFECNNPCYFLSLRDPRRGDWRLGGLEAWRFGGRSGGKKEGGKGGNEYSRKGEDEERRKGGKQERRKGGEQERKK